MLIQPTEPPKNCKICDDNITSIGKLGPGCWIWKLDFMNGHKEGWVSLTNWSENSIALAVSLGATFAIPTDPDKVRTLVYLQKIETGLGNVPEKVITELREKELIAWSGTKFYVAGKGEQLLNER